jgi:ubiquinone/menaquinone biosynthesis C-methylase UbiE/uncharacterized protein YbaR (Trm112 family)
MTPVLLQLLCCPFCSGEFQFKVAEQSGDDHQYGVLKCDCGEYPVVAGIPVLKKGAVGSAGQSADEVISLIEAGKYRDALIAMVVPPPPEVAAEAPAEVRATDKWRQVAEAYLANPNQQLTCAEILDFYFNPARVNARNQYYYFVFRFSMPRHLVPLCLASIIQQPSKPVVEVGCGYGHITRSLIAQAAPQPVLGLDRDFFMLHIGKKFVAPAVEFICADADGGLPFPDKTFSAVTSSDAFHLFAGKSNCFRELERITSDDGSVILASLRNGTIDNHRYPGTLPPAGYKRLTGGMPHVLVSNRDILARYLQKQGPSLVRSAELEQLNSEPWMSMVASHRQETFRDYDRMEEWPHALGKLKLNPLYIQEQGAESGNINLQRVFPSPWYEQENAEHDNQKYLPETLSIDSKVLVDLDRANRTAEVETLIARGVVLGFPDRFIPDNFSNAPENVFDLFEEIGGSFYIEKVRISDCIAALIPSGDTLILVDGNRWGIDKVIAGRRVMPFLERNGEYWGSPADDQNAINELERLRQSGANFIVFGWPAVWWLDHYCEFARYLYSKFRCVLQSSKLVVFDLRL